MSNSPEFIDYVVELASSSGRVSARSMFGGHGIYVDGTIVAIVVDDVLYFKTDDETRPAFIERDLDPFSYEARGKVQRTSYFRAPDDALENASAMREWLRRALAASLRSGAAKRKRAPKSTTPKR